MKGINLREKNGSWKGGISTQECVCQKCGKNFIASGSMINSDKYRAKGKYCSIDCFSKSQIKLKVEKKCLICNKDFSVIQARTKAKYCSPECRKVGVGLTLTKSKEHHRTKSQLKERNRRARQILAEGQFTMEEWELLKREYHHRCPSCGKSEPFIQLTVDHIIPLIKGGSNWIWNIQPLCGSCNSSKCAKTICFSKTIIGQTKINFLKEV
jgi:5-methylcytosine-specific restriction endonuclease McrA